MKTDKLIFFDPNFFRPREYAIELMTELAKLGVQTKPYVHLTDDGYEVATFAYLDDMIPEAIQHFLDDAHQATSKTCVSPLLDGKMFRYVKAIDAEVV